MLPVGNPAIGDDFIDREKEIAQILAALKKDSVLLIAPRRFGKTSIMRRMEKGLKFYSKMLRDWWRVYYGDSE